MTSFTSVFAFVMVLLMENMVSSSAIVSAMPTVKPWCNNQ